jgi:hypothetical protein
LLLGAVPFPKDVPHLKNLGVGGVITLNEPYETLVPSSLYHVSGVPFCFLDYLVFAFCKLIVCYEGKLQLGIFGKSIYSWVAFN